MFQLTNGSFRLFRVAGITVYLHWLWFFFAYLEFFKDPRDPPFAYSSRMWNLLEYLALFGIVLLHEFGHALACRQVGGTADRIVLWPLGGIAFVNPPPRPGALLWSIVAGPLVNVVLVPVTVGLVVLSRVLGWNEQFPDLAHLLVMIAIINGVLLGFNLLPIYPLDGGQILQALLWFVLGRARSLFVASLIGLLAGIAALLAAAVVPEFRDPWLLILAVFVVLQALGGFARARVLLSNLNRPRHAGLTCPACGEAPPSGPLWGCNRCRTRFDTFAEKAVCPGCGEIFPTTQCPHCGQRQHIAAWFPSVLPAKPGPEPLPE
jgi:Zn-dependent protease